MPFTEPIIVLKSRLLRPKPKRYRPMPLMPCSACKVTLITAISRPISMPTTIEAATPSQRLPVLKTT